MKRKTYSKLLEWKQQEHGESALLIEGARRVGKSWLVEEFAKNEYDAHLLLDFSRIGDDIKAIFHNHLDDIDEFFHLLLNALGVRLPHRRSLVVFDEVQLFPRAREAIKALVADGRYDYVETGSLMSIKENTNGILIPSEESHLKMFPMDFEEFLWATGNDDLMDVIAEHFTARRPLGPALHRRAMACFREYLVVGGMPQAVAKYAASRELAAADREKRKILALYRDDIARHAGRYAGKVRRVFDELPSQLSRHEKRFRLSALGKNAKARTYEDAFLWLEDAMIVNVCYNATEPSVGLRMNRDSSAFKCYMADTGLLVSHAFDAQELAAEQIHRRILLDNIELNEGMLVENVVAQMLAATGKPLYFFSKYDKANAAERMEIDFLIAKSKIGRRKNISPIEVKSRHNYTATSLEKFCAKYRMQTDMPYIVHPGDLLAEEDMTLLPLYMTPLL
ncbi:MAG: ATP-binding protein [Kiritimatiellae bacterium]|nr:ATP-binding protein [Kiritimatiellia bacterium]